MLKYRELKEKNKIKTCICTSLLPTCGQGEDKLVLCVTTYGRNADTTRETYKSACGNVKCKHFIVPTALLDQRNGQRHMCRQMGKLRHPRATESVSAKCRRCLPRCLLFTRSDKLLVQSHYRGLHPGCLSLHGTLSLSLSILMLSAYPITSQSVCPLPL